MLEQAFAIAPAETVCVEVMQKGIAEMGERWYAGSASVQHEHFATTLATRRIHILITATPPPNQAERILAACPPGEEHSFALLLSAYLLRRQGWDVVYLGADVPLKDLGCTIQSVKPRLVISAAQTLPGAASLKLMAGIVGQNDVNLAYGGGVFVQLPEARRSMPGFYLGDEISQVAHRVEQLLTAPPMRPGIREARPEYMQALAVFEQNEALIRAQVAAELQARHLAPIFLEVASAHLPRLIAAGLSLGDTRLLEQPIAWLNGWLRNNNLSTSRRVDFYRAYTQAAEHYLGTEGVIITDFLKQAELWASTGS